MMFTGKVPVQWLVTLWKQLFGTGNMPLRASYDFDETSNNSKELKALRG